MLDKCEHTDKNDDFLADIEKYGLTVVLIQATDYLPSFGYTIGLWKNYKHPEIIGFGLNTETLHIVLNDIAELVKSGQTIETYKNYPNIFESGKAVFISVDQKNLTDYFGTAINLYNTENFPAIQLVWTDRNDRFPWETDFEEEFKYNQPLLDRNADFKFIEDKNLGIFTTRQWLELEKPILRVIHDIDGDWQFLSGDQLPEDIRYVSLEEIIKRDSTLNEVFNLEYGESANRKFINGQWLRTKENNED
ncbi:MAG: DUF4262 domain-containing protein [Paludibacter sp.]|nr:DUF4262 domain-containing protein [Paludibacter sp.]